MCGLCYCNQGKPRIGECWVERYKWKHMSSWWSPTNTSRGLVLWVTLNIWLPSRALASNGWDNCSVFKLSVFAKSQSMRLSSAPESMSTPKEMVVSWCFTLISVKAQGGNSAEEKRLTSTLPSTGEPALLLDMLRGDDLAAHNRSTFLPADDNDAPLWTIWLVPAAWVPLHPQRTPYAVEPVMGSVMNSANWVKRLQRGSGGDQPMMPLGFGLVYAPVNDCQFLWLGLSKESKLDSRSRGTNKSWIWSKSPLRKTS